jgi:hypothetical protein
VPVDDPKAKSKLSLRPLMRYWTEQAVQNRDSYDFDNGHGGGNLQVSFLFNFH